eukprot:gene6506-8280_t
MKPIKFLGLVTTALITGCSNTSFSPSSFKVYEPGTQFGNRHGSSFWLDTPCPKPAQASAQDLPNLSLLTRYGVTEDQLPAAPTDLALSTEPTKSRFEVQPERPLIRLEKNGNLVSETTGNISIDNAAAQSQVQCARAYAELERRGSQRSLPCGDG